MVKNKLMTSMLAISLVATPGMVWAMVIKDTDIATRILELQNKKTVTQNSDEKEIKRLEAKIMASKSDDNKQKYYTDRVMVLTLKKQEAELSKNAVKKDNEVKKEAPAKSLEQVQKEIKLLQQAINKYELDNASLTQKIVGWVAVGSAGLVALSAVSNHAGPALTKIYYGIGADKFMPKLLSWGWTGLVYGLSAWRLATVAQGGKVSISKIGRKLTNNCVARTICKWWNSNDKVVS